MTDTRRYHGEEEALVAAIGNGDTAALAALYERLAGVVLAVAERIIGVRREAEDLVHDVFLELWQHAGEFDPSRASARTWILVRTRSRALDRKRSVRISRTSPLDALPDWPAAAPEAENDAERLRVALASLPTEQQQVLHLAYFEGLSATEVAATLGVPVGTVKSRIAGGRLKLRRQLGVSS